MNIKQLISCGELDPDCKTTEDVLASAGRALDHAASYDICGAVFFEGEDGKFYRVVVEALIEECDEEDIEAELGSEG